MDRWIEACIEPVTLTTAPQIQVVPAEHLADHPPQQVADNLARHLGSVFGQADITHVTTARPYPHTRPRSRCARAAGHSWRSPYRPIFTVDGLLRVAAFTAEAAAIRILDRLDGIAAQPPDRDGKRRIPLDTS